MWIPFLFSHENTYFADVPRAPDFFPGQHCNLSRGVHSRHQDGVQPTGAWDGADGPLRPRAINSRKGCHQRCQAGKSHINTINGGFKWF